MRNSLALFYERHLLAKPVSSLFLIFLLIVISAWYIQDFKLDISADSLVLENDKDLHYYRSINARYGSDDYLIITYTPKVDLFASEVLDDLANLRNSQSVKYFSRCGCPIFILYLAVVFLFWGIKSI